jgi:RNA polymerase sigma-70 factor, ECF subfamily
MTAGPTSCSRSMKETREPSDEDLLARSRTGDEAAFADLYRRRQAPLFRFALRMSGSPALAEDVVQEVFMALIHTPERFDPAAGSLLGFLFGIARNRVRRHLEKRGRHVPLEGPERDEASSAPATEREPEADLVHQESVAALHEAVLSLPDVYREVVVLVELEELSYADAAEALDCALGTVRSRLHRARRMLTEKMRGNEAAPVGARRGAEGRYA